jgi:hypothetical protein
LASPDVPAVRAWLHVAETSARRGLLPAGAPGVTRVAGQDEIRSPDGIPPAEEQQGAIRPEARERAGIPVWILCGGSGPGATVRAELRLSRAALFLVFPPEQYEVLFWTG